MRKVFVLLVFSFSLLTLQAQSLKDIFFKMPQEVCPALSEYNRLELIDNQKNNKPMQTRNIFKSFSKMDVLTDDYAHLIVSKNSEKTMKLLNSKEGTPVVMVISTVFADSIPDASIAFYTTEWKPLDPTCFISAPISKDFRRITINPDTNELTITTLQPLTIRFDDANQSEETQYLTNTFIWSTDDAQFITHN